MNRTFLLATVLVATSSGSAQDWAKQVLEKSNRHQEWITVKNDDRTVHAFVVYPETKKKAPVVVVIHENQGLTDWVKTVADQLAAEGYIAVAPDLLSGSGPEGGRTDAFASGDAARQAIRTLPAEQVTGDLNAIADYAKKIPAGNGKIAVAGFCWGGGQTFRFAGDRQDITAAFVFYGPSPEQYDSIRAPVYGFYGENDARINAALPQTEDAMKKAGKTFEPVIYKGAGHGFMRSGMAPDAKADDVKARTDAWKRWLKLLKAI